MINYSAMIITVSKSIFVLALLPRKETEEVVQIKEETPYELKGDGVAVQTSAADSLFLNPI